MWAFNRAEAATIFGLWEGALLGIREPRPEDVVVCDCASPPCADDP
eukprot:gene54728-35677_t